VESIGGNAGNYVLTGEKSGRTREKSAWIGVTFAVTSETVALTCANIAKTSGKAHRSKSYAPIGAKFGLTRMRFVVTAETSG
jgi:hypothetical protein